MRYSRIDNIISVIGDLEDYATLDTILVHARAMDGFESSTRSDMRRFMICIQMSTKRTASELESWLCRVYFKPKAKAAGV